MAILIKTTQSDFCCVATLSLHNPLRAKALLIVLCRLLQRFVDLDPSFSFVKNVMIGDGEKTITVVFVPLNDRFRKIIAVAPERMRVKIPSYNFV